MTSAAGMLCFMLLIIPLADGAIRWLKIGDLTSNGMWPAPRKDFAIGYDASRRFLVIFGGEGSRGEPLSDTWIFDLFLSGFCDNLLQINFMRVRFQIVGTAAIIKDQVDAMAQLT